MLNARPPAALGLWSIPLPTVIDTILRALAPALPDRSQASENYLWFFASPAPHSKAG